MISIFLQFRNYSKIFYKHLGYKIFYIIGLTLIVGFLDVLGITMVIPLFEAISSKYEGQQSSQISIFLGQFLGQENIKNISFLTISIVSIFIAKGILVFASLSTIAYILSRFLAKLKKEFFFQFSKTNYEYYLGKDTGYFTNIANEQINLSLTSFSNYAKLVSHCINTIIYLITTLVLAWKLSFLAIIGGGLVMLLFRPVSAFIVKMSKLRAAKNGELSQKLIQAIQAFKYISATNSIGRFYPSINLTIDKISNLNFRSNVASSIIQGLKEPIIIILILVILFVQTEVFGEGFGPIIASLLLFYRSINSILGIQISWQATLDSAGSLELYDEEVRSLKENVNITNNVKEFPKELTIKFIDVFFKFNNDSDYLLKKINLTIPQNKFVAITGISGSGKSTFTNLLTTILTPTHGTIKFGDLDLKSLDIELLKSNIGYVSQELVIFDDTIENNIIMWDQTGSNETRRKKMIQAATKAGLDNFISNLEDGFSTLVGDRGARISGGQRQRICIARELYKSPKILILDEATSALDREIEEKINENIFKLKEELTIIFVTHHYNTIKRADLILVLEDGEIVEAGPAKQLLNNPASAIQNLFQVKGITS